MKSTAGRRRGVPGVSRWPIVVALALLLAPLIIYNPVSAFWTEPLPDPVDSSNPAPAILSEGAGEILLKLPPANHDDDPHQGEREGDPPPDAGSPTSDILSLEPFATLEPTAIPTRVLLTPIPTEDPRPPITPRPSATSTPAATPAIPPAATTAPITTTASTVITRTGTTSASDIEYVVIISVDGLRPDGLDLTDTPTFDKLRKGGSFSPNAQTISLSITLPSLASMLGGMVQDKHGILFGIPFIGWPGMSGPTVFSVAHDAGYSTGMVFGKNKLSYISLPGSGSVDVMYSDDVHDPEVTIEAIKVIEEDMPNVLFIHLPDVDRVGHAYGWLSEHQLHAITYADGKVGEIIDALEQGGYWDRTLLIITADHGGHGKGHGDDAPQDRTIPWIAIGPGVPQNHILTSPIRTFDTAATALQAFNLPIPDVWDGRPILEIFPSDSADTMVTAEPSN